MSKPTHQSKTSFNMSIDFFANLNLLISLREDNKKNGK